MNPPPQSSEFRDSLEIHHLVLLDACKLEPCAQGFRTSNTVGIHTFDHATSCRLSTSATLFAQIELTFGFLFPKFLFSRRGFYLFFFLFHQFRNLRLLGFLKFRLLWIISNSKTFFCKGKLFQLGRQVACKLLRIDFTWCYVHLQSQSYQRYPELQLSMAFQGFFGHLQQPFQL